jgi:hypothetical protein
MADDRGPEMSVGRWLAQRLKALAMLPIALLILFEEWGWEPLKRAMAWVMRWPPLAWLERGIARLPPSAALLVFLAPTLLLLPVKLAALWLIGQGQALLGLVVIVVAKIAGTALIARLFHLTQPALMKLGWFARFYSAWSLWKEAMFMRVRASWAWRAGRVVKKRVVQRWRRLTRSASSTS